MTAVLTGELSPAEVRGGSRVLAGQPNTPSVPGVRVLSCGHAAIRSSCSRR